jgi:hypothetical protein
MKKTAYETAKQRNGKYYGFYNTHSKLSEPELFKSIKSSLAQIDKHRKWVDNPRTKNPDFYCLDPRQQKNLIEVHWPADIQRHRDQIEIINGILKDRGYRDDHDN